MQSLCQAYTVDPSYQFQAGSAFNLLSRRTSESIPELVQLLKSCIHPLLTAIEKFKAGYSSEEINKKCLALQEAYISFSAQLSECKAENQQIKEKNLNLEEAVRKKQMEIEDLKATKDKLVVEVARNGSAVNCKCRCRCGARKSEIEEDYDDIKEIKAELSRVKEEKMFYALAAEEKSEKIGKLQMEMEISEIMNILLKEDENLTELETQLRILTSTIVELEKEKEDAQNSLNIIKKEQIHMKTSNNFKSVIEDLEEEKIRLKKQIQDLSKEKSELNTRFEDEQRKVHELKDQIVLKEIALQKYAKEESSTSISENELEFRLKEYKNEVTELKNQIKIKDNTINKLESTVRNVKNDLKNEKRNSEALFNEIEVTGNAYEETLKKNKALAAQLLIIEQNCIQLMNERIREENWKSLLEKKHRILEEQIASKDNLVAHLKGVIEEEQKVSNNRLEVINLLETKFKTLEQKFFSMNATQIESNRKYDELLASKKDIQEKLKQAEKICIKSATECMQYKFLYENSEKSLKDLEEKVVQTKDMQFSRNADENYIAQIAKYRELIRCSQCRMRNKDCLLTKCLHMYCRRCIELNLSQKKRKCPSCYTKFTSDDIRTFYWS